MPAGKVHAHEVDTNVTLVGWLVAAQFPQFSFAAPARSRPRASGQDLPIAPVRSAGTDNALYRLGDEMVVRRVDSTNGPPPGEYNSFRGVPLATRDAKTRAAIASLHGAIDVGAVTAAWEGVLEAPAWDARPSGSTETSNPELQAVHGRLSAVIDFGCLERGGSRMRRDGRADIPLQGDAGRVPHCASRRRWDLLSRSLLGTLRRAYRAPVLAGHQPCARRHRPTRFR